MIGHKIIELQRVNSTNIFLEDQYANQLAEDGMVVIANEQYAGKGQDRNKWSSDPGENLTLSVFLNPNFLDPALQFKLSEVVALAVCETVRDFVPPSFQVCIKWPNDVYINDLKISGILIKNYISGRIFDASIVGIGINVNQKVFPKEIPNPVSLSLVAQAPIPINEVVTVLIRKFNNWYQELYSENYYHIDSKYMSNLYRKTGFYPYKINRKSIIARIIGLDEYGKLMLESETGTCYSCDLKEVSFIL